MVTSAGGLWALVVGIDGMADKAALDAWINSNQLTVTAVRDPDGAYPQSQRYLVTREWSYVVDLHTMKVVFKQFGSYGGGQPSVDSINAAITDILGRLK